MTVELAYTVLDQNTLRDPQLVGDAFREAASYGTAVLLPDVALMEMMKGSNWEYATRRSLEFLAKRPEAVCVAWGTGDLLRRELEVERPRVELVDEVTTEAFRRVLERLATNPATALSDVAPLVPQAQSLATGQWLDHTKNKQHVESLVGRWKDILSLEELKALRSGDSAFFTKLLASDQLSALVESWITGSGDYSAAAVERLAHERSIVSHLCLARAALALRWLRDGGVECLPAQKMTNDDRHGVRAGRHLLHQVGVEGGEGRRDVGHAADRG